MGHSLPPSLRYASLSGYADIARTLGLDPVALMRGAGLDVLAVTPLTFGVAHLYVATPAKGAHK